MFGLFCLTGLFFWFGAKPYRLPLFLTGFVSIIALVSILWLTPDLHQRFIDTTAYSLKSGHDSSYGRVLGNGVTAWRLSPIFGVGPKNYYNACVTEGIKAGFRNAETYKGDALYCARHPHNIYLEWLVETGAIGLLLFLGLVFIWLRTAWRHYRTAPPDQRFTQLGFFIGLIPFLWPLTTSMSFFSNWNAILFWWVLGLALAARPKTMDQSA